MGNQKQKIHQILVSLEQLHLVYSIKKIENKIKINKKKGK
jgi:hypothetical protein